MQAWNPSGKLAVVTGASSGIGRCLTTLLIQQGCRVIAIARRQEKLQSLADQFAESSAEAAALLIPLVGDVTKPADRQRVVERIDELGGQLDLLVNNAGIGGIGPFQEASPERLRQIMEVNFFAPVELSRLLLPRLSSAQDAVLCNVGSVLGHCAVPDKSEYCASKFAMHGWTDSLRTELAGSGVSVVLVSPSTTRSEFFDSLVETDSKMESKSVGSWSAQRVAGAALAAIKKHKREVVLSAGGKALVYADRIIPGIISRILSRK